MWEKDPIAAGTGSAAQVGTTLRVCSVKYNLEAVGVLDLSSNRLLLSMRSGESVWQSEWLDVSPLLGRVDMAQLTRQGLERWLLLATLHCSRHKNGLSPLELASTLIAQLEHGLA